MAVAVVHVVVPFQSSVEPSEALPLDPPATRTWPEESTLGDSNVAECC